MNKKIVRLPDSVINQIAAGEVVENPASIVKELIENSLDAGAGRIHVEIRQGGLLSIAIEDDGCGMGRDDALASLDRHATSKLKEFEDLTRLKTMGFRGEALAAISAVSHFKMTTAAGGEATAVLAEGGVVSSIGPCARNQGTTVEVSSLFYNVPARKKFQKSARASTGQIVRMIESIALAHPEVAFTLISDGVRAIEVRSESPKERVEAILGAQDHEVDFSRDGMRLWGFIAKPGSAAANRLNQYFFINRRPIFCPLFARAVKEGYGTRIDESLYPPFVLFLEISPDAVDINVHPQKKEARFRNDSQIFQFGSDAVSSAFEGGPVFERPISFEWPKPFPFSMAETAQQLAMEETALPISFPERPVAVFEGFLILEWEKPLLVDLRGAEARIFYDSLTAKNEERQSLLWPLEIELKKGEEEIEVALTEMGIEHRLLGRGILAIDSIPALMSVADFPQFFQVWREKKNLSLSAVSFSRSRTRIFSLEEGFSLWKRLKSCRDSIYDPVGNRIWRELEKKDFERLLLGSN